MHRAQSSNTLSHCPMHRSNFHPSQEVPSFSSCYPMDHSELKSGELCLPKKTIYRAAAGQMVVNMYVKTPRSVRALAAGLYSEPLTRHGPPDANHWRQVLVRLRAPRGHRAPQRRATPARQKRWRRNGSAALRQAKAHGRRSGCRAARTLNRHCRNLGRACADAAGWGDFRG